MSIFISDDDAETISACLDYIINRCGSRNSSVHVSVGSIDEFALKLSRRKVGNIRAKLFPNKEIKS